MNKDRRARLGTIADVLEFQQGQLGEVAAEESAAYENLPESIQDGDRGLAMTEAADEMVDIASDLEDLVARLRYIAAV